tara:strand:+ start:2579 stop:2764 length:186 start_codon:yes stop_codon:yes gene_type:complete
MKIILVLMFTIIIGCGYPDIDSVPNFKDLELTKEELFDLCELSEADKSNLNKCIEEKINNK